jgi:hypothetical protein
LLIVSPAITTLFRPSAQHCKRRLKTGTEKKAD